MTLREWTSCRALKRYIHGICSIHVIESTRFPSSQPTALPNGNMQLMLPPCAFCGLSEDQADSAAGTFLQIFLAPPTKPRPDGTLVRAHERCADLSPDVYMDDHGAYHGVVQAARRGRSVKCFSCQGRGATVRCEVSECERTYHAACAVASNWRFRPKKRFLCGEHRPTYGGSLLDHDPDDSEPIGRLLGAASGTWCPACEKPDPLSPVSKSYFFLN